MLRIDTIETDDATLFRLEGRVIGAWVAEVRRSCDDALARRRRLTLDLASVSYVDPDGVALLRELTRRHVTFANATPFVAAQLEGGRP
jgi:ABC-type transporter Mla MlaB component